MNKNILINMLMFATGAAIGSVVTLRLVETKYAQIAQDEIDEMREFYEDQISELLGDEKDEDLDEEVDEATAKIFSKKPDLMEYAAKINEHKYNVEKKKEEEMMNEAHIRVVSPEEFDDCEFEAISLVYYSDEVLAYENDEVIPDEEIDDLIGHESLGTFGRFEEDSVYVIDYDSEIAYEICKDYRTYSEVSGQED